MMTGNEYLYLLAIAHLRPISSGRYFSI